MMKSIKKIDIHAHAHAFPQYDPPYPDGNHFVSAEELIGFYDRLGIEKGVLLPSTSPEGQMEIMSNGETKSLVDKYSDRFTWFCNVDPRAVDNTEVSDLGRVLEFYKKLGAKGVGEVTANIYADDPRMQNLFGSCAELSLPVTIHINNEFKSYGIVDELYLPRLEKMLKMFPKLKILGHSQCFWSEISADNTDKIRRGYPEGKVTEGRIAKLMREYEGLCCDLSAGSGSNAMMRDPDYTARFIEEFSDRIYYGCDICLYKMTRQQRFKDFLEKMLDDKMISRENYYKIVRGNAEKLLGS